MHDGCYSLSSDQKRIASWTTKHGNKELNPMKTKLRPAPMAPITGASTRHSTFHWRASAVMSARTAKRPRSTGASNRIHVPLLSGVFRLDPHQTTIHKPTQQDRTEAMERFFSVSLVPFFSI